MQLNNQNQMLGFQPFPNMFGFPVNNPMLNQNMNLQNNIYNSNPFNNQLNYNLPNLPLNNAFTPINNYQPYNFYQINNNNQYNNVIQNNNNSNIINNNNIQTSNFNQINNYIQNNNNIFSNNSNPIINNNIFNIQINNNAENNNEIHLENNNNYNLDITRKDIFPDNAKMFNILEAENEIYIANTKKFELIKILRDDTSNIERINNKSVIPKKLTQKAQTDGIIGIFDLNYIKYLGIITDYEESATILNSKIYLIKSIELIKISKTKEFLYNEELNKNINDLFSTKNFYYSNDYKLSLSLNKNSQEEKNSKYLLNHLLLTSFFDNNIPDYFYSKIILGFASSKNNIKFENEQISLDIIIIERYFNENILIRNFDLIYIKQIEFISIFKNINNNEDSKTFSFICYQNGEAINSISSFVPFKAILMDELKQFQNLVCIINNLKKEISTKVIKNIMKSYNANLLNNKIKNINFTSDWKKELFEGFNFDDHLDFISNTSSEVQKNSFWFIDINNNNLENNICINSLKTLFWTLLQKEINFLKMNINIGNFDKSNKNMIFKRFSELLDLYETNITINKRLLILDKQKEMFQVILDKYLKDNINKEEPQNPNKINVLCITWNLGGHQLEDDYDISEIFKKNNFYYCGQSPDIVVISFQEIVKLNTTNTLKSKNDKKFIEKYNNKLNNVLNKVFPGQNYKASPSFDQVGLYLILFCRQEILGKIIFVDVSKDKTGRFNLGNKGFFTLSFKYMDNIFSIASGHLESGFDENNKRIETLNGILNKGIRVDPDKIQKFKDADFWVILGDLNFRINMSYDNAMSLISEKNYKDLYSMDQFHLAYEEEANIFLKNNINEGTINFAPTYKFEENSDNYTFDKKKVRVPSWCDRILFCKKNGIKNVSYDSIPNLKISDHRPVTAAFEIIPNKKENKDLKDVENQNKFFDGFEIL